MKIYFALLLFTLSFLSSASPYVSVVRADEHGKQLAIARTDGKTISAPLLPNQIGFDLPVVSKSGRYVGWGAKFGGGPLQQIAPITLVVMNDSGKLLVFEGIQEEVDGWCFTSREDHVVFSQVADPRRGIPVHVELRRLSDGKLIAFRNLHRGAKSPADQIARLTWAKCF